VVWPPAESRSARHSDRSPALGRASAISSRLNFCDKRRSSLSADTSTEIFPRRACFSSTGTLGPTKCTLTGTSENRVKMDARSGRRGSRASRDPVAQPVEWFAQRLSMRFVDPESQGKPRRICLSPWILAALRRGRGRGRRVYVGEVSCRRELVLKTTSRGEQRQPFSLKKVLFTGPKPLRWQRLMGDGSVAAKRTP
jgi:hypothetical protein